MSSSKNVLLQSKNQIRAQHFLVVAGEAKTFEKNTLRKKFQQLNGENEMNINLKLHISFSCSKISTKNTKNRNAMRQHTTRNWNDSATEETTLITWFICCNVCARQQNAFLARVYFVDLNTVLIYSLTFFSLSLSSLQLKSFWQRHKMHMCACALQS